MVELFFYYCTQPVRTFKWKDCCCRRNADVDMQYLLVVAVGGFAGLPGSVTVERTFGLKRFNCIR